MRQMFITIPEGRGAEAADVVRDHGGRNVSRLPVEGDDDHGELLLAHVPNDRVESVLEELEKLGEIEITLNPRGMIALYPPVEEAPDQVVDVAMRTPLEIFLAGLQSIGSWKGFISYAAAGGMIVWIGFFTNTIFLMIAAMLIAPFAGPAMNLAIGTARGDSVLIRRSLLRYLVGLAVSMAVAAAMTLLLQQEIATSLMIDLSKVSSVAVVLPLVAGAAGAMNLLQSDRSSLVSGAAVGMLVAASIAPPVGLVGMAGALGEWGMAGSGLFLLALQLVAINLSGALVFSLAGLSWEGARYDRGRKWLSIASLVVSALILAALLTLQFSRSPALQRSTDSQRAAADIQKAVESTRIARLVEVNVRFTRADIRGQKSLLCVLYVQPLGTEYSDEQVRAAVEEAVALRLQRENVTPLLSVQIVRSLPDQSTALTVD